ARCLSLRRPQARPPHEALAFGTHCPPLSLLQAVEPICPSTAPDTITPAPVLCRCWWAQHTAARPPTRGRPKPQTLPAPCPPGAPPPPHGSLGGAPPGDPPPPPPRQPPTPGARGGGGGPRPGGAPPAPSNVRLSPSTRGLNCPGRPSRPPCPPALAAATRA